MQREDAAGGAQGHPNAPFQMGNLQANGNDVVQHAGNEGQGAGHPLGVGNNPGGAAAGGGNPGGAGAEAVGGQPDLGRFGLDHEGGGVREGMREWIRNRARLRLPGPETIEDAVVTRDRGLISWSDLTSRFSRENFDSFFLSDISFRNIALYDVKEDDDLGEAIRTHCKVALNPSVTYVIRHTIFLNIPCYVIGNGASVVVECDLAFDIDSRTFSPLVVGMEDCVFLNISFERSTLRNGRVRAIRSYRSLVIQNCMFLGFLSTCIHARGGASIRGCQFLCCHMCIRSENLTCTVKQCIFERCVIGMLGLSKLIVRRCTSVECYTFVIFAAMGKMISCTAFGPPSMSPLRNVRICTCLCGHVRRLHNIHVVSNRRLSWPVFNRNTFSRMNVFLGNRRGVFHPISTAFSFCIINVEPAAASRLTLNHCYEGFCLVRRLTQIASSEDEPACSMTQMYCHCEDVHLVCSQRVVDITRSTVPNRRILSCNTGDYSSEEEDSE